MRESTLFETIAARLLARQGIGVIWQLHLRASASHLRGNWLAAAALIGIGRCCRETVGASCQVVKGGAGCSSVVRADCNKSLRFPKTAVVLSRLAWSRGG